MVKCADTVPKSTSGYDGGNYAELPVMPTGAYGPVQDGGFRCNLAA
jgi:hypothetical protein